MRAAIGVLVGAMAAVACMAQTVPQATPQINHGRDGIILPPPPVVEAVPVSDNYFGTKIPDSYRWLEDARSPETRAFIDAQNAYTSRYMKQARIRNQAVDDLTALEDVSSVQMPAERGGNYFFLKRLTGEQQYSIYVRKGWTPVAGATGAVNAKDVRLVDPAKLNRDPNTSVGIADVSRDGSLLAYTQQVGGADESSIHVFNVKTGKTLEDELPTARYFRLNFAPDGASFYYARNDKQGTLLYQHVLGTRNARDKLIFGREYRGEELTGNDLFSGTVTDDGRYLVVQISRGVPARRVDIVYRDLTRPGAPFEVLVWGLDARFNAIYAKGAWYVKTDYKSPNGRIMKADPGVMPEAWDTIVPEGKDVIDNWSIVGGKLYVGRLKDAKTETEVYTLQGKAAGTIGQDGIGSASAMNGRVTDRYAFFSFASFVVPPIIYRLDTETGKKDIFFQAKVPFESEQYALKQVFFKSKDGTRIPMFIAGRKNRMDLKQDGTARLLMTGYGGFDVSVLPGWSAFLAWWLQQGGYIAVPNLRGGGEYGESWHEQGMFEKKQTVFDDWFAAAQYLIKEKYTSPEHFAIMGRSNGGLLMGASMTQHPELFAAIDCGYPLLDMLRYQKFLVGSYWETEYGSAENEKQFFYLLKYSPYHNVKPHTDYPAILFFTGDSDTRVDPLHARKMTALMQSASTSGRPVLLHYSEVGGHNGGMSVDQQVQDDADQLAFLWTETGPVAASQAKSKPGQPN